MPRLAAPICVALLLAALVTGCGSGGSSTGESETGTVGGGTATTGGGHAGGGQGAAPAKKPPSAEAGGAPAKSCDSYSVDAKELRATGVGCGAARAVMFAWQRVDACALGNHARGSCSVPGGYRCQAARVGKGVSASCAAKGRAIAFLAQRD